MNYKKINIALVGFGNIGSYFFKTVNSNKKKIASKTGKIPVIKYISTKSLNKKRKINLPKNKWIRNPIHLTNKKDVDVIVELVGGSGGIAKKLVLNALKNKKHVITANKALIAKHGDQLARLAETNGEILALDALTGSVLWNSSLVIEGSISGTLELTDIDSGPVIHDGLIYASSLSGKFAVIDLISGTFIWEIPIKTSNNSIINGDSVFISSDDGRVINVLKDNGEVRWIANIYEALKIESNGTPLCSTPILAKNNIILSCYDGNVFKINSSNGDYEKLINLGEASFISPIIINGHIIFYTEDAELIVYR